MGRRFLFCAFVLGCWLGPFALGASGPAAKVDEVLKASAFANGQWGLLVVDRETGETVYERNADQMFCPASVTKLFTTAAAWVDLGPDYRFHTPVRRRGDVDEHGTLHGDLVLVASGDLCLGGRAGPDGTLLFTNNDHTYSSGNFRSTLVPSDPLAGLEALAKDVAAAGIRVVNGDVLVDDRLFAQAPSSGSGPTRVAPIVINDNVVDLVVSPGCAAGDPASVRTVPKTAFLSVENQVETVPENERPSLRVVPIGARRVAIQGKLPVGHREAVRYAEVEDPASFARTLLIEVLRRLGVRVTAPALGENATAHLPARSEISGLPVVAEFASPPLREYVKVILKVSHNLYASTLPLLLAAHHGEHTLGQGLKREAEHLGELDVSVPTIAFGGGAGGSRADLVTPRATVALLRAMTRQPEFSAYDAALPVLGRDGTLARAVPEDSPARGHARAKTGTYSVEDALQGKVVLTSKALAGYMETARGRRLAFAFFVNNVPADPKAADVAALTDGAGRLLGRLCEVFYDDQATQP
jgi:D-alanyl-D-alanine carboxypeptidase/D-alanyl-D-alanine-endopeptidase (penicillin-binding protein 4)